MYRNPNSLTDALDTLASGPWKILAGGTDFYPSMVGGMRPKRILDVSRIGDLRAINTAENGTIEIGSLCTWTDIIKAKLPAAFDGLKFAAKEVGSIQIQNRATIVGNICNASPAADGVPPLLTLDARVRIQSRGANRELPLSEFILGNRNTDLQVGEMATHIVVPADAAQGKAGFLKLGARKYLVISIAMVAARLVVDEDNIIRQAAVAVGSCSEVAKRLPDIEQALVGQACGSDFAELIEGVGIEGLSPIDDVRATKHYRHAASSELVGRTLRQAAGVTS